MIDEIKDFFKNLNEALKMFGQVGLEDEIKRQMQEGEDSYKNDQLSEPRTETTPVGFEESQMSSAGNQSTETTPIIPPAQTEATPKATPKATTKATTKAAATGQSISKNNSAADNLLEQGDGESVTSEVDVAKQNADTQEELAKATFQRDEDKIFKEITNIPGNREITDIPGDQGDYRDDMHWLPRLFAPSQKQLDANKEGRHYQHMFSSGENFMPGSIGDYIQARAEAEAKMSPRNNDIAEQRERKSLKEEINNLGKQYKEGIINKDTYHTGMNDLSQRYEEIYGHAPVRVDNPTTDANRRHIDKETRALLKAKDNWNALNDPNMNETQKKLLAFNIFKEFSGDTGKISDPERIHFLYGSFSPEFKEMIADELQSYINQMQLIAARAGQSQLPANLKRIKNAAAETVPVLDADGNPVLDKKGKPKVEPKYSLAEQASMLKAAFMDAASAQPAYKEQIDALKAGFEAWQHGVLWHAPISIDHLNNLMERLLKDKESNLRIMGNKHRVDVEPVINEIRAEMLPSMAIKGEMTVDEHGNPTSFQQAVKNWKVPSLSGKSYVGGK